MIEFHDRIILKIRNDPLKITSSLKGSIITVAKMRKKAFTFVSNRTNSDSFSMKSETGNTGPLHKIQRVKITP